MNRKNVSAIVVTYFTGPRLKECLYALGSDPDIDEIVIVDNGNPGLVEAWLEDFCHQQPKAHRLSGQGNIGFGAAVNLGVSGSKGPHLLVINPDAVLRRGSLAPMQGLAKTRQEPWIIGGKIFDLYGREERGPRRRDLTLWRAFTRAFGWNTWTLENTPPPTGPVTMPVISGALFLTSQSSWTQLGGFDEAYFLHVEDVDLCRRCREAGGEVFYDPRAAALHYGSTSDAPSAAVSRFKADGLAVYFRKFARGPLHRLAISGLMPFIRLGLNIKRS